MTELHTLSARDTAAGVLRGDFTVEALVSAYAERIDAIDPAVGAWAFLDIAAATEQARAIDRSGGKGALAGIVFGAKDVIASADMPTAFGSAAYAGNRPVSDAACIAMARQHGAILAGKTVTTEFAAAAPGGTRNPHDPLRTPGGSSSGSAAAVAAQMIPIAFGTQTAGSTIRPAAYCGVVGFKPSFGLIDIAGTKALASCFDTIGVFARDVRDIGFFVGRLLGTARFDGMERPSAPRIGVYRGGAWNDAQPCAIEIVESAAARLSKAGAALDAAPILPELGDLDAIHRRMMAWGMTTALAHEHRMLADRVAPATRAMLEHFAATASADDFAAAEEEAIAARLRIGELFGDRQVLMTPAASGEAPLGLESTGEASFNRGWTMLRLPCITVPAGSGPDGMPLGIQLIGRHGEDALLLAVAAFVEDMLR